MTSYADGTVHRPFVNRHQQREIVLDFVDRVAASSRDRRTKAEPRAASDNVLVFHGMPGIGKSRLLREVFEEIERAEVEDEAAHPSRCAALIALDGPDLFDPDAILLRIWAAATTVSGAAWPMFNHGMVSYLGRYRPDMTSPYQSEREDSDEAIALVGSAIAAVLSQHGFGLRGLTPVVVKVGERLAREFMHNVRVGRLEQREPLRTVLDSREPQAMRQQLPTLLTEDLASQGAPVTIVCFLDGWEHVLNAGQHLEADLRSMIFRLPDVAFVIAGQQPLQWQTAPDGPSSLGGRRRWPRLDPSAADSDQHRLDRLDRADCVAYLKSAQQQPPLDERILQAIADRSEGSPFHLSVLLEFVRDRGADVDFSSFDDRELLARYERHLPTEQQDLLQAAALLGHFDTDGWLLAAAVPTPVRHRAVRSFLRRSIVRFDRTRWLSGSLHSLVYDAVAAGSAGSDACWSPAERVLAARRALEALGDALGELRDPSTVHRERLAEAFRCAVGLCPIAELVPDWMYEAMACLAVQGQWSVLETAAALEPREAGRPGAVAAAGLAADGLVARHTGDLQRAENMLVRALTAQLSSAPRHQMMSWLAELWTVQHALDRATGVLLVPLAQGESRVSEEARKDLARNDWLRGRFPDADRWVRTHVASPSPLRRAQAQALGGWLLLADGQIGEAVQRFRAVLTDAALTRARIASGTGSRNLAWGLAWVDPAAGRAAAATALRENEQRRDGIGVAQAHACRALAAAGHDGDRVREDAGTAIRKLHDAASGVELWYGLVPLILHACITGDHAAAAAGRRRLEAHLRTTGTGEFWLAVTGWWMEELGWASRPSAVDVDWLSPQHDVRARWLQILESRSTSGS